MSGVVMRHIAAKRSLVTDALMGNVFAITVVQRGLGQDAGLPVIRDPPGSIILKADSLPPGPPPVSGLPTLGGLDCPGSLPGPSGSAYVD